MNRKVARSTAPESAREFSSCVAIHFQLATLQTTGSGPFVLTAAVIGVAAACGGAYSVDGLAAVYATWWLGIVRGGVAAGTSPAMFTKVNGKMTRSTVTESTRESSLYTSAHFELPM